MHNSIGTSLLIFGFLCLVSTNSSGQKNVPKNLNQTIRLLDKDCPDSLKAIIKITESKDLKSLSYPWGNSQYKIIYNWLDKEDSGIYKYLNSKGIINFQVEVILENYKKHLLNEPIIEDSILHPYLERERKWKLEDENRSTTDSLRGVYIPKNLEDCFIQINFFWNDSTKTLVKNWDEKEFTSRVHLGFGMWIRNNWQLWGGSRLSKYFTDLGIQHPDDMSGIILVSYHRYLNNKEIKLDELVKDSHEYWQIAAVKELKRKQEEFSAYRIGDTLEYNYNKGFVSKQQEEKYDNDICYAKGIVIERNEEEFLIKVRVVQTCDKKGIIYYDNEDLKIYDPKTRLSRDPPKRIIRKMKKNEEQWFDFGNWEKIEE